MYNKNWLVFSFSLPARLQPARVKIWRRLNALGAVHLKNSLYLLPGTPHHLEQLTWLAREAEELGGEATLIAGGELVGTAPEQVQAVFTRARDEDFAVLEEEILSFQAGLAVGQGQAPALRRFARRLEALRGIDFFPSGRGEALGRLLHALGEAATAPPPDVAPCRVEDFQGKTWVTRPDLHVDRMASFWLVRRFIDPSARLALRPAPGTVPDGPDEVLFDVDRGTFTHRSGLITFEVMVQAFGLGSRIPARMRQVLRAIDLEEADAVPAEAPGVKRLIDGLVRSCPEDSARMDRALTLFDTLLASYEVGESQQPNETNGE